MEASVPNQEVDDLAGQIENLKNGIREIAHEISNPLGIIRMAAYFLHTTVSAAEKNERYFKMIDENLERIEQNLQRLKELRENPSVKYQNPQDS